MCFASFRNNPPLEVLKFCCPVFLACVRPGLSRPFFPVELGRIFTLPSLLISPRDRFGLTFLIVCLTFCNCSFADCPSRRVYRLLPPIAPPHKPMGKSPLPAPQTFCASFCASLFFFFFIPGIGWPFFPVASMVLPPGVPALETFPTPVRRRFFCQTPGP